MRRMVVICLPLTMYQLYFYLIAGSVRNLRHIRLAVPQNKKNFP